MESSWRTLRRRCIGCDDTLFRMILGAWWQRHSAVRWKGRRDGWLTDLAQTRMIGREELIYLQESRASAWRTARCRCKYRYVSNTSIMERLCSTVTLSTRTHLAQASTKHLESRLQVIQGHAFWDHWKADEGLRITCIIMWALESEISKERFEHLYFREPHCHSAPPI